MIMIGGNINTVHVAKINNNASLCCWAFGPVESVEGAWAIKDKLLFNLSEQELVDC